MILIERLARDLCTGLQLDPDLKFIDYRKYEPIFNSETPIEDKLIPQWMFFIEAITKMIMTLRDHPTEKMIERGNVGIRKVASIPDPQSQVPWRYMVNELLTSLESAQVTYCGNNSNTVL